MEPADQFPRIRVAAIIVRNGTILLVRHTKEGCSYWMLPGGGVNFGESLAESLVRELREELGVTIRPGRLVLASDAIAPDGCRHIVNLCFTAEIIEGEPARGEDPRITAAAFVPIEALTEIPFFPPFSEELLRLAHEGFPRHAVYAGNLWTPLPQ